MLRRMLVVFAYALGFLPRETPRRAWSVDRDGRVKTDKHRPVVLRARAN